MKTFFGLPSASMVAFLGLWVALLPGCEVIPEYEIALGNDSEPVQNQTAPPAETPPAETPPAATPQYATGGGYGGSFVAGDESSDGGPEIYTLVNGMQVRLLANDATKTPGCADDYYNISGDVVEEAHALTWSGNTFTARDFTSSRSGKKYRWMGWTIARSANPLVTSNPLTLGSFSGTLRCYWATVK